MIAMLEFLRLHRVEITTLTLEHIWLVAVSMAIAVLIGVPT
jgi:ABC-type proline/glycine betaine transport system permease subunit